MGSAAAAHNGGDPAGERPGADPVCLDAIVIGGGPAGLSAATWLARYRRTVLVLDSGEYRNRWADASHGYLSRDRASPAELLTRARVTRHSDLVDGHHRRPAAVAAPGPVSVNTR